MIHRLLAIGWLAASSLALAQSAPAKSGDAKSADAKASDAKASDAKASDVKASDAKAPDTKAPDAKPSEAKSADSTSADAKTADAAAPAEIPKTNPEPPKVDDVALERYRTPFEALNERKIGESTRAVRFDWRKKTVAFGIVGSQLLELNNFGSARVGGFLRTAVSSLLVEFAVSWVVTWPSDSSEKLALTPYRQFGRPSRLELDLNASFPLAEGVATARPGFFPATEFVFSLTAGLRYLIYPGAMGGMDGGQVLGAIFATKLTQQEFDNLELTRQPSMQVDGARYSLLVGFSLDIYLPPGLFFSPRVMMGLPVFSALNGGGLGVWWELTASLGWML